MIIKRNVLDEDRAKAGSSARTISGTAWRAAAASARPHCAKMLDRSDSNLLSFPAVSRVCRYQQSAIRAVNQALGRVIRHRNDYGAVILADERFFDKNIQSELSKWLRNSMANYDNFGKVTHRRARERRRGASASVGRGGKSSPPCSQRENESLFPSRGSALSSPRRLSLALAFRQSQPGSVLQGESGSFGGPAPA